jgi:hypothetical protein
MSIIDKIQFWKRKDEHFDLGQYPGLEANAPLEPLGEGRFPENPVPELNELGPAPLPPQGMGRGQGIASPLAPTRAGASADPSSFLTQPAPSNFAPSQAPQDSSREFQVVNAKLDTLKAILDGINAKLDRMDAPKKEEVELVPLQRRWR